MRESEMTEAEIQAEYALLEKAYEGWDKFMAKEGASMTEHLLSEAERDREAYAEWRDVVRGERL